MQPNVILVVGSLNMDLVVNVPRTPTLGETLLGAGSLKLVPGGKGLIKLWRGLALELPYQWRRSYVRYLSTCTKSTGAGYDGSR